MMSSVRLWLSSSMLVREKVEARRSRGCVGGAGERECEEVRLWALLWRRGPRKRVVDVDEGALSDGLVEVVKVEARLGGWGCGGGECGFGSGSGIVIVVVESITEWSNGEA